MGVRTQQGIVGSQRDDDERLGDRSQVSPDFTYVGSTYLKHGIRTLKQAGTLGEIQSGEVEED